jgi:hypothetical protein
MFKHVADFQALPGTTILDTNNPQCRISREAAKITKSGPHSLCFKGLFRVLRAFA